MSLHSADSNCQGSPKGLGMNKFVVLYAPKVIWEVNFAKHLLGYYACDGL